jgi:hypothetical protein
MISSNGNWHSDYIKLCKTRSIESLRYVIDDCRAAIQALPDNIKSGQYQDEINYCLMELKRREN